MRKQNITVSPVAATLQVTVFVGVLFALAALLAHSFMHSSTGPAELAGETMQIIHFP